MDQMTVAELASAAVAAGEADLTTYGRTTGKPSRRAIWITADSSGRVHVRSGQGLSRDWPRNLLANPRAVLHISGKAVAVRARHVTDRAELRASHDALKQKYGWELPASGTGEALTLAEQATFALTPVAHDERFHP
jgi:deazaflavin-dependent oxidoreductase (nitroreductase family)